MESSDQNTIEGLNFFGAQGYRVSQKEAHISKQQVKYLGYIINLRSRQLTQDRKTSYIRPKHSKYKETYPHLLEYGRIL